MKQFNNNTAEISTTDKDLLKVLNTLRAVLDSKGWEYTNEDFEVVDRALCDIEINQQPLNNI